MPLATTAMEDMVMVMAIMIIPIATATITMAIPTKIAIVDGLIIVAQIVVVTGLSIAARIVIAAHMVLVAPKNKVWLRQGWHCLFCYPLTISTNNL